MNQSNYPRAYDIARRRFSEITTAEVDDLHDNSGEDAYGTSAISTIYKVALVLRCIAESNLDDLLITSRPVERVRLEIGHAQGKLPIMWPTVIDDPNAISIGVEKDERLFNHSEDLLKRVSRHADVNFRPKVLVSPMNSFRVPAHVRLCVYEWSQTRFSIIQCLPLSPL